MMKGLNPHFILKQKENCWFIGNHYAIIKVKLEKLKDNKPTVLVQDLRL
jgi:hypothetical protein